MIIRRGSEDDLQALVALQNHYIANTHVTFDVDPVTVEDRMPWLRDHENGGRYQLLVAVDDAGLLGYCTTSRFRPKRAYETTVEITVGCTPGQTRRGVGTALYTRLFEELAREDIHRVVAAIAQPNEASVALHERFGFERAGLLKQVGRKFGQYWDVLWMQKAMR